ncbi:MAG: 3-phosphoshikimate 1-carboxyvinyltransferase [Chitinophagaceae bacterium]
MSELHESMTIAPGMLRGMVAGPPSKSVMQRVLAIVLLRNLSLKIFNAGSSADDDVLKEILKQAGFILEEIEPNILNIIAPVEKQSFTEISFGESGLAARMMTPILALRNERIKLIAKPALEARPMTFLEDVLPMLGVEVKSIGARFPAEIKGPMKIQDVSVDGALSSQFLTGLLLAFSMHANDDVVIKVRNLVSKPYVELTLKVISDFGLPIPKNEGFEKFYFQGNAALKTSPTQYTIEGDWSAASMWLVAGAIAGPITVSGLDAFSAQADKKILEALMDAGASLSIEASQITCDPATLKAFQFDATDCPDLFPALAVLACYAKGTSVIEGLNRLEHKESNRALSIQSELGKMGAEITFQDNLMLIRGGALIGAELHSFNDHRIAMMCAIAALGAEGDSRILGADAVRKSYPNFFGELGRLRV